jgi:hypothetical protein
LHPTIFKCGLYASSLGLSKKFCFRKIEDLCSGIARTFRYVIDLCCIAVGTKSIVAQ